VRQIQLDDLWSAAAGICIFVDVTEMSMTDAQAHPYAHGHQVITACGVILNILMRVAAVVSCHLNVTTVCHEPFMQSVKRLITPNNFLQISNAWCS